MQFFIILGIMVSVSAAYLLHQFWRRSLTEPAETDIPDDGEEQEAGLKAA